MNRALFMVVIVIVCNACAFDLNRWIATNEPRMKRGADILLNKAEVLVDLHCKRMPCEYLGLNSTDYDPVGYRVDFSGISNEHKLLDRQWPFILDFTSFQSERLNYDVVLRAGTTVIDRARVDIIANKFSEVPESLVGSTESLNIRLTEADPLRTNITWNDRPCCYLSAEMSIQNLSKAEVPLSEHSDAFVFTKANGEVRTRELVQQHRSFKYPAPSLLPGRTVRFTFTVEWNPVEKVSFKIAGLNKEIPLALTARKAISGYIAQIR